MIYFLHDERMMSALPSPQRVNRWTWSWQEVRLSLLRMMAEDGRFALQRRNWYNNTFGSIQRIWTEKEKADQKLLHQPHFHPNASRAVAALLINRILLCRTIIILRAVATVEIIIPFYGRRIAPQQSARGRKNNQLLHRIVWKKHMLLWIEAALKKNTTIP